MRMSHSMHPSIHPSMHPSIHACARRDPSSRCTHSNHFSAVHQNFRGQTLSSVTQRLSPSTTKGGVTPKGKSLHHENPIHPPAHPMSTKKYAHLCSPSLPLTSLSLPYSTSHPKIGFVHHPTASHRIPPHPTASHRTPPHRTPPHPSASLPLRNHRAPAARLRCGDPGDPR